MTTPAAVWTKTETPHNLRYRHTNGVNLLQDIHKLWSVRNDDDSYHEVPAVSAMRSLAKALDVATYREQSNATCNHQLPVHLTVDQLVQAIADLHFGGLP
jgi:hypothetical protein